MAEPFTFIVAGETGGRAPSGRLLVVDRDNVDALPARLDVVFEAAVSDRRPGAAGRLSVAVRLPSLDAFHPDQLVRAVPALRTLLEHRAEPPPGAGDRVASPAPAAANPPPPPAVAGEGLLDRVLAASGGGSAEAAPVPAVEDLARRVTTPHLHTDRSESRAAWAAAVDRVIGSQLCAIMHHPSFRTLEATWRTIVGLAGRLETGPDLRFALLDAPWSDVGDALAQALESPLGPRRGVVVVCPEIDADGLGTLATLTR